MSLLVYVLLASDRDLLGQVIDQVDDRFNGFRWSLDQLGRDGPDDYLRRAMGRYVHARIIQQKNQPVQDWMLNGLIADLKLIRENSSGETGILTRAFLLLALRNYPAKVAAEAGSLKSSLEQEVLKDLRSWVAAKSSDDLHFESIAVTWPGHLPALLSVLGAAVAETVQKDPELLRSLTEKIMARFNGDAFGSTFDTAITLNFSRWIVDAEARNQAVAAANRAALPWQVQSDGRMLTGNEVKVTPRLGGWNIQFPSVSTAVGDHRVQLQGGTIPLARADLRLEKSASIQDWPAVPGRYHLKRQVFLMDEKSNTKIPVDGKEVAVKLGDLVYIELTFDPGAVEFSRPTGSPIRYYSAPYLFLRDSLPSGLVPLDEDSFYEQAPFHLALGKAAHVQRMIERSEIRWYLNATRFLGSDREIKLGYLARAQSAGTFLGGTASLEDFYDEASSSRTNSISWKVEAQ